MRGVLLAVLSHVRHMAVDTGDTGVSVDARRPSLEVRMLCLEHRGLGICMDPVLLEGTSLTGLIELILRLRIEPVVKRMVDAAVFLREVVLIVALCADVSALVVVRSVVDIDAAAGHRVDEALLVDAQLHRLRIVARRAAKPLVVLNGCHDFVDRLRGVIPAALLVVDIVHVRALAGDAVALLAGQALRVLEVLACVRVTAVIIILERKLVALEVLDHLRLFRQVRVLRLGTAVPRRRRRSVIVLHERIVLERISFLIGFLAELFVLGNLSELDTRVVRCRDDADDDKAKEYNADSYDSRQYLL